MNNLHFDRVVNLAAKDTKKGARVVAKVFYRILRKNDFSENQIIEIATNMLSCLTESLKGYKEKVEKTSKKEVMADEEYSSMKNLMFISEVFFR